MRRAAGFLQDQQIGPATQSAEQAAIDRLARLLTAMEPEKLDDPPPDDNVRNSRDGSNIVRNDPPGTGGNRPAGGLIMLAEVKLIKLWQEDLNRRTQQLELDAASKPRKALRERYDQLADEQARLAAATVQLLRPAKADVDARQDDTNAKKGEQNETEN